MNDVKVMNRAADNIRILAASMVEKAKSGHPGGAMGGADFIIFRFMNNVNKHCIAILLNPLAVNISAIDF